MLNSSNKAVVNLQYLDKVALISIDYPPVNALSQSVKSGLLDAIAKANNQPEINVMIIRCQSKTFIAGADIKEFGKPATEPFLPDVLETIEKSPKPIIASLFGTCLGGGFELALACQYRIALTQTKVGLPEVNLGLIPGSGGTQRLPRIIGVKQSLDLISSGKSVTVNALEKSELFDAIYAQDLDENTLNFAQNLSNSSNRISKTLPEFMLIDDDFDWEIQKKSIVKKARGSNAPVAVYDVLHHTHQMKLKDGLAYERETFLKLRDSEQAAALRHIFAAEKKAAKPSQQATALNVNHVSVIGGGNMGSGIATCALLAKLQVLLIEQSEEALSFGLERVRKNLSSMLKSQRISEQQYHDCLAQLYGSCDYHDLQKSELIIEAVFEDLEIKKIVFAQIDKHCALNAILASNTSYLDINELALSVKQPEKVVGLHFFSPAHVMKLLEVVNTASTNAQTLATAMALGKKLNKIIVEVGVCFGFAANRTYTRYGREIQQMLLEGATVVQVDNAMKNWGMAMGPLAVQDLSGIEIGHNARSTQPFPEHDQGYFRAAATLVAANRLGRKTGCGFYAYDEQGQAIADPTVDQLIKEEAQKLQIKTKDFTDEEIVHRALFALISEGLTLMDNGIVQNLSDVDVIWVNGYGFPRYKGGPMFQASLMGAEKVKQELDILRAQFGNLIWPEPNLKWLNS